MNRTNPILLSALLLAGCFEDTGGMSSTGDDTSGGTTGATDSGSSTGDASSTGAGSGSDGGSTESGSGGSSGSTGGADGSSGSTGAGETGGSTGASTGSTGGTGGSTTGPAFRDLYEPCEEDAECMSGVCAESSAGQAQDSTWGYCAIPCDPMDSEPCAGAPSPFEGWEAHCWKESDTEKYVCGIKCAGTPPCPTGWKCQSYSNNQGFWGACFEEV